MHTHEAPSTAPKTRPQAGGEVTSSTPEGIQLIEDKRPEAILQRKLIESIKVHTSGGAVAPGGVVQRVPSDQEPEDEGQELRLKIEAAIERLLKSLENFDLDSVDTQAVAPQKAHAEKTGLIETGNGELDKDEFIEYFTLMPGIKYSKVAQELKYNRPDKYKDMRTEFTNRYLKLQKDFNTSLLSEEHRGELSPSPKHALKTLDVMHPKSEHEGQLIVRLDQANTELNQTIAGSLDPSYVEDPEEGSQDHTVGAEGGITAKHSAAFRKMLKYREHQGELLIRPAGKHAVDLLDKNMPAKPLWIKGKSIDMSKLFDANTIALLTVYLQEVQTIKDDPKIFIESLKQGFIPMNQLYSKWLRGALSKIKETEPHKVDYDGETIAKVRELLKAANHDIEEMENKGLIKADGDTGLYVAEPGGEFKPYTGDYDMYSISNANTFEGQKRELNVIRGKARKTIPRPSDIVDEPNQTQASDGSENPALQKGGNYESEDIIKLIKEKNPYVAMADQGGKSDPAKVHKLFGNISRYEMGMKIDLNAAAITWGGYTAGQVIKHGAESRNFAFPQEILDGIVEVSQQGSVYNKEAIDEKVDEDPDLKYYNPSLLEIANRLAAASHELPLNPRLVEAIKKVQSTLPPIYGNRFNVEPSAGPENGEQPPPLSLPKLDGAVSTETLGDSDGIQEDRPTREISLTSVARGGYLKGMQPKGKGKAKYIEPNTSVTKTLAEARAERADQTNFNQGHRPLPLRLYSLVERSQNEDLLNNQTD